MLTRFAVITDKLLWQVSHGSPGTEDVKNKQSTHIIIDKSESSGPQCGHV